MTALLRLSLPVAALCSGLAGCYPALRTGNRQAGASHSRRLA